MNKTVDEIQNEIKSMRKQFIEMNEKLNDFLNGYNMAKTQFKPK